MAEFIYSIDGLKELQNALLDLEPKVARKYATKSLREAMKLILEEARSRCPVKSGATKKALRIRAGRNKKGYRSVTVVIGNKWFTGEEFYAAFVLFGHRQGSRKLGNARKEIPANPWLEQAAIAKEGASVEKLTETLGQLIEDGWPQANL